jgi:hypothetical protein
MLDIKSEKHRLSIEYNFAAEDIDESIIPILVILDRVSTNTFLSNSQFRESFDLIDKELRKAKQPIYCDKPKTALLVGIGKMGSISIAVSIFFSVFWIGLVLTKNQESRYEHIEKIASIVQYDNKSGNYFIEKKYIKKVKNGVILYVRHEKTSN